MSNRTTLVEDDRKAELVSPNQIALVEDDRKIELLKELVEFDGSLNLAFEFTVNASNSFSLPLIASGVYNFTIVWDKGGSADTDVITAYDQAEVTHDFGAPGTYLCSVTGTLTSWQFDNNSEATKLTNISNWGDGVLSINNTRAFYGCDNLTITADAGQKPTISGVSTGYRMFRGCSSLTTVPGLSTWDFSGVTSMLEFAILATSFNEALPTNATNLTRIDGAFRASALNQNIAHIITSSMTNMNTALLDVDEFDQDLSGADVTGLTSATNFMLNADGLSTANYDATLIGWAAQAVNSGVSIHFGSSTYSAGTAATARATLVSAGWTITDGGQV